MKNYTTKIDAAQTVGEIQATLAKFGAEKISFDYKGGFPTAITFLLDFEGNKNLFCIEADANGALEALKLDKKVSKTYQTIEQGQRVAWRITKDYIAIQLSFVEMRQATIQKVFLPYLVVQNGQTLFDYIKSEQGQKLLTQ